MRLGKPLAVGIAEERETEVTAVPEPVAGMSAQETGARTDTAAGPAPARGVRAPERERTPVGR